jgi:hypothetical protein
VLLALAYWRKRRHNRRRLGEWERQERAQDEAEGKVVAPPYVPWPGEDPFADVDEDREGPKTVN